MVVYAFEILFRILLVIPHFVFKKVLEPVSIVFYLNFVHPMY
jgi:hypothetical protein